MYFLTFTFLQSSLCMGGCCLDSSGLRKQPVAGFVNTVMNLQVACKAENLLLS
jgi:hypothetical protein